MRRKLLVAMLMLMAVMVLFGCSDSDPQNEAGDAVQYYDFFGERQLSDEELEALCHETDEKIIKRKISTVADCAKYFELMQAQQTGQLSTSASCAEAFNHLLMNDYDEGGTGSFKYKSRTYTLPYISREIYQH